MMKNNDIKRNGSGYYDPTAYKAILNMEERDMKKDDFKVGEIWEVEIQSRDVFPMIVLAKGDGVVTGLRLVSEVNDRNDISVPCGKYGQMHTCSRMIQYTFSTNLTSFIRCLTDNELADVREKIAINFGIARAMVVSAKTHDNSDMIKLKYELDGYKYLYEKALNDIVKLKEIT